MPAHPPREALSLTRLLADQVFARVAGVPLVPGNHLRLLRDAADHFPAWMEAIQSARRTIHFDTYIMRNDAVGRDFAGALMEKARQGVAVRLIYDWLGALGETRPRFWRRLRAAGVEVRCFNPPQLVSPFGWLSRDHRKMLAVDGVHGFVTGVCVSGKWVGDPKRGLEPWRDTGVELRGPAVADIEQAFAEVWATMGPPLPDEEIPGRADLAAEGEAGVRIVAGTPHTAGIYRLDHLIAAGARERLWLTDAYFIATTSYVQALRTAALDGVDVRLLVPGSSDISIIGPLSRAMYRPLLEGGVRVFEWKGSMLHAKSAVADGRWARVGSTNLNLASWIGNWELDVAVEDGAFARQMEEMYLADLANATEVVLTARRRPQLSGPARHHNGRARRAAAGAMGLGSALGASITNRRVLGPAESRVMAMLAIFLAVLTVVAVIWPRAIAAPLAVIGGWVSISLLVRAVKLRRKRRPPLRRAGGPAPPR